MAIAGKIAKILNSREIIINKGSQDGVEVGMKFEVQDPGINVVDPDSKKDLGRLTRPKITVEIV